MSNPIQTFWEYQVAKFHLQVALWGDLAPWVTGVAVVAWTVYILYRMLNDRRR